MKPPDAESWERHMRLERDLLAQRRDGKLAKAIGKALPGESPQDLQEIAREDQSKAQEGLVALLWSGGGKLSYKHIDELLVEYSVKRKGRGSLSSSSFCNRFKTCPQPQSSYNVQQTGLAKITPLLKVPGSPLH
jgi:hypothetical protein